MAARYETFYRHVLSLAGGRRIPRLPDTAAG
jgi:hypothetical protein